MKILDDIKAKREAATEHQMFGHFIARNDDCRSYYNRMDPRTVEAMENVIRAAAGLEFDEYGKASMDDVSFLTKTLEELERVDD